MSSHRPHLSPRPLHALIGLSLLAVRTGFASGQDRSPAARVADPMAGFACLVPDEWRMTAQSGQSMFHAWHWGPGRHSIRRMTDGSGAGGEPWREVQVYYWHPGRKQVRLLVLSPFARGVGEGMIRFDGKIADGTFDLDQTKGRRRMGLRWAFDGPDRYRETLLEATGPNGYEPLVELELIRSEPPATPRPRAVEGASKPSERLKALAPLLGQAGEARAEWVAGGAFPLQTTVEWVPLADAFYARVLTPGKDGEPRHRLDAYVYHHTGTGALRCLALSDRGGVYEGDLTMLDGGALQIDLMGYEGDRARPHVVRLDFDEDGSLHHRVWSLEGNRRVPLLDVHQRERDPNR